MKKQIGMKKLFFTDMLFYLIAMMTGLWLIADLVESATVQNPSGCSLVHLLVLEFAAMVAIRAGCQFIQVILRTSLYSKRLAFVHYSFSLAGGQITTMAMASLYIMELRCVLCY